MGVDHISLPTGPAHFAAMRDFYTEVLGAIGYKLVISSDAVAGFKADDKPTPDFFLHLGDVDFPAVTGSAEQKHRGKSHIAFSVGGPAQADALYKAAMTMGGTDNGAPGFRPIIPGYYAAFFLDPLGNNVEACHFGSA